MIICGDGGGGRLGSNEAPPSGRSKLILIQVGRRILSPLLRARIGRSNGAINSTNSNNDLNN